MKLNLESLHNKEAWEKIGVKLPGFDVEKVVKATAEAPIWIHFGAGNIFRGFIAVLQQRLLEQGLSDKGIIASDTFDYEVIDKIYKPFDNLTMVVTLNGDGSTDREIVASVTEAVKADSGDAKDMARLTEIFESKSLQMVSFTITEKGYALYRPDGTLMPVVEADMKEGPESARHAMSMMSALLLKRYKAGAYPIAMVSMDNCSHNGEKLKGSVLEIVHAWQKNGYVDDDFVAWIEDETKVSFPWSMIDKITPRPAESVKEALIKDGVEDMEPIITSKNTYIAGFVNAEKAQYLVVEDRFPAGRPPLEKAGVYMTDRDTVNMTERMKVTTCLNPLHTAMSMYGCLLNYQTIASEMADEDIVKLISTLGYTEGLPVVTDPGILSPKAFIDEVVQERLPNPFMPDTPWRIATDTSQKVPIRFGETVKSYVAKGMDINDLRALPLAIAGWMRYLLGINDAGEEMEVSSDPLKEHLQKQLETIVWNDPESYSGQLIPILSNTTIFGCDLVEAGLSDKIEGYFREMLEGEGSVRKTLHKHIQGGE